MALAPSSPAPLPEDPPSEEERVRAYKMTRLLEFGYDEDMAALMAGRGVDVHFVQALIVRGATLFEAARIAL